MGYKVQFDNGMGVEFDHPPSQQDIDEAHKHLLDSKMNQVTGYAGQVLDKIGGVGEFLTKGAADAALGTGAKIVGGIIGGLDPNGTGGEGAQALTDAYQNSAVHKFLEPSTQTAKDLGEWVGDKVNKWNDAADLFVEKGEQNPNMTEPEKMVRRGVGALAKAAPDLLMLDMIHGGVGGVKKAAELTTKGVDAVKTKFEKTPTPSKSNINEDALFGGNVETTPGDTGNAAFSEMANQLNTDMRNPGGNIPDNVKTPKGMRTIARVNGQDVQVPIDDNTLITNGLSNDGLQSPVGRSTPLEQPQGDPTAWMAQQLEATQPKTDPYAFGRGETPQEMWLRLLQEREPDLSFEQAQERAMAALEAHGRQVAAQRALAERQAAMEKQVKDNMPVTPTEDQLASIRDIQDRVQGQRTMGATADALLSPAEQARRQAIREGRPTEGENPLYVTPDGQALNVRPDDAAMDALARQKEAGQNALDNNIATKRGQPLDLLSRDQLRLSNEGPQANVVDIMQGQLRDELLKQKIDEHPFVKAAEDRITKQEELITKLSEQVQKGKAPATRLTREMKNLENLERVRDTVRSNVENGIKQGRTPTKSSPFRGPGRKEAGAINPEAFREGFEKLKKLADGTWLRAHSDGRSLTVDAHKDGHIIGTTEFSPEYVDRIHSDEQNASALITKVKPEFQRQGYATEMYKFARELGNDIQPSSLRTNDGKAMWDGFEKKGFLSPDHLMRKKEAGALRLPFQDRNKAKWLSENPALKLPGIVPTKMTAEDARAEALKEKDISNDLIDKTANQFGKGMYMAVKRADNSLVKFGVEQFLDADRQYRGDVQQYVHGALGTVSRDLSKSEAAAIWKIVERGDKEQKSFTEDQLRAAGANDKQIAYYKTHREVMDKAFDAINQVRNDLGMEPIDKRVAYAAMRATGDFKRMVFSDPELKNVVGVIGSDTRSMLNQRAEHLASQGFHVGPEKYMGGMNMKGSNIEKVLMDTLQALAEQDPRVEAFMKAADKMYSDEAYGMLNMKKHTMPKKGIFGMEGRKPWETDEVNAKEGMQAQLAFAEQAFKWQRMTEAVAKVKPLLTDEKIDMPNAKKWLGDYMQKALGYNPSEAGRTIENGVAKLFGEMGQGYSRYRRGAAMAKKIVNTILLSDNPMFLLTNMVQPEKAMPGMVQYLHAKGMPEMSNQLGWGDLARATATLMKSQMDYNKLNNIEKGALDYALTHHVYGSDMIEHSNRAQKDAGYYVDKVTNFGAQSVESFTRAQAYLAFVHMLDRHGLSVKDGLYTAAQNLTDHIMNNYSPLERPKIYDVLGPVGHTAANLSSYRWNEVSRMAMYARELANLKKGDLNAVRPMLGEMASTIAFAGIKGVVGYEAADELYKLITKLMGHPDSLNALVIRSSEKLGKLVAPNVENAKYVLSHGGFSLMGLNMSDRLGLNNFFGNSDSDLVFPGVSKLGEIGKNAVNMVYDTKGQDGLHAPSSMDAKRLVRSMSPGVLTGAEDMTWFSTNGGTIAHNKNTLEPQVKRNGADMLWKAIGGTGIHESVEKEKLFEQKQITKAWEARRAGVVSNMRDALFENGNRLSPDQAQSFARDYVKYQGDPRSFITELQRMVKAQALTAREALMVRDAMSKTITKQYEAQRLNEAFGNR